MPSTYNFYIDDSGTRHPDKKVGRCPAHGHDWFSMGGIIVKQEDEVVARQMHADFLAKWEIHAPLHSSEIRAKSDNFKFIGPLTKSEQIVFYEELYQLLVQMPVVGMACVIDRPGYKERYDSYGSQRWMLCKTAFSIAIERAAKFSNREDRKLNIYVEKSDKNSDSKIKEYYKDIKANGMPFNKETSSKYDPADQRILQDVLYDLKFKEKSSPMIQIADLFLWPICMGGYGSNVPYDRLREDGKLIESFLHRDEIERLGIKYSCFEKVKPAEASLLQPSTMTS